jgi:hypothetical protein
MKDTIRSRVHRINLELFTQAQCKEYGKMICEKEGLNLKDSTLTLMAVQAQGQLRDMVNGGIESCVFMCEDSYVKQYSQVLNQIEKYFVNLDVPTKEVVESLYGFHPVELKSLMMMFFREEILNPAGRYHDKPFNQSLHGRLFAQWLRYAGLVKDQDDFFSMLYVFRNILVQVGKR